MTTKRMTTTTFTGAAGAALNTMRGPYSSTTSTTSSRVAAGDDRDRVASSSSSAFFRSSSSRFLLVTVFLLFVVGSVTPEQQIHQQQQPHQSMDDVAPPPALYTCSEYSTATVVALPHLTREDIDDIEDMGLLLEQTSSTSSSSSTTAATGASYNTISFIVADIVCPSSSDSDAGKTTPTNQHQEGNEDEDATTIQNWNVTRISSSTSNTNMQHIEYYYEHVPTHIHIYVIDNYRYDDNDAVVKNELRYKAYPPQSVTPEIRKTSDLVSTKQYYDVPQEVYGLYFVYNETIKNTNTSNTNNNKSNSNSTSHGSFGLDDRATIELWVPMETIEASVIIGPAKDHALEILYIQEDSNKIPPPPLSPSKTEEEDNDDEETNATLQQAEETSRDEVLATLEDLFQDSDDALLLEEIQKSVPLIKPRIVLYTNGFDTSTTVRVLEDTTTNTAATTATDTEQQQQAQQHMSVLIIDESYNSTLQFEVAEKATVAFNNTTTPTSHHNHIISKSTNSQTTIVSSSSNMTGTFYGRQGQVYLTGTIQDISITGTFINAYAYYTNTTTTNSDTHSICDNVTIATVLSSKCITVMDETNSYSNPKSDDNPSDNYNNNSTNDTSTDELQHLLQDGSFDIQPMPCLSEPRHDAMTNQTDDNKANTVITTCSYFIPSAAPLPTTIPLFLRQSSLYSIMYGVVFYSFC